MPKRRFYTNIDINSVTTPFLNRAADKDPSDPALLWPFVDQYAGTELTDILFDVFCQYAAVDTDYWTTYREKFEQKEENGVPVAYTEQYRGLCAFHDHGIDPYAVWLARAKEKGLTPWLSVRMNDCHCPDEEACFLRSDFFYEAREKGWMVGDAYGYYRYCFDYAVPEVRRRMLGLIGDILAGYDPGGLELDFQRELFCFDYPNRPDCAEIMTEFLRAVRRMVREAEARLGHPVRLGVRLMRDIRQNKAYGFDAEAWVNEGLVDLITVSPRWETCDGDMPVCEWKKRFPDIEIAACITDLILCGTQDVGGTPAAVSGYALRFLADGADSVYLFNFFMDPGADPERLQYTHPYDRMNRICGREETLLPLPRRVIVAYQDMCPAGFEPYRPLPLTDGEIPVRLGILPGNARIALLAGIGEGDAQKAEITVNGRPVTGLTPCDRGRVDADRPNRFWKQLSPRASVLLRAELENDGEPVQIVRIRSGGACELIYLEIETY